MAAQTSAGCTISSSSRSASNRDHIISDMDIIVGSSGFTGRSMRKHSASRIFCAFTIGGCDSNDLSTRPCAAVYGARALTAARESLCALQTAWAEGYPSAVRVWAEHLYHQCGGGSALSAWKGDQQQRCVPQRRLGDKGATCGAYPCSPAVQQPLFLPRFTPASQADSPLAQ